MNSYINRKGEILRLGDIVSLPGESDDDDYENPIQSLYKIVSIDKEGANSGLAVRVKYYGFVYIYSSKSNINMGIFYNKKHQRRSTTNAALTWRGFAMTCELFKKHKKNIG